MKEQLLKIWKVFVGLVRHFFNVLTIPIRVILQRVTRRKAAIFFELFALFIGAIFALSSYSILREVGGLPLNLEPSNSNYLEKSDYDGGELGAFSVRHDCNHVLQANLDIYLRPNSESHHLHEPLKLYQSILRQSSKQYSAGDLQIELRFHNFDEPLDCRLIAIHVPGVIDDYSYLIRKENHGEWNRVDPLLLPGDTDKSIEELAAGAKILIPMDKYPKFESIGFVWKDALQHLGDYHIGLRLRSGYFQNLEESASGSVSTFLTKIHSPRGYIKRSASYREDREPQKYSHAAGEVHIYRFSGLFNGTPLAVSYTKRVGQAERESRLILWSTLLGLGIGILVEALFSLLRTIASQPTKEAT